MRTACAIVREAQFIDYTVPSVAQHKHRVGGEMPHDLLLFCRKKQRTIKRKMRSHKGRGLATCRRRKIDAIIAVELRPPG